MVRIFCLRKTGPVHILGKYTYLLPALDRKIAPINYFIPTFVIISNAISRKKLKYFKKFPNNYVNFCCFRGYNETYAVAGRIKDLHDEEGLLEVDFTPFQMNNKTLLSGKCQPGWTLLDSTCYMYHGGPMTYRQAHEFCKKDNATIPYIKNIYWYHTLTQYLESQQEDWR